MEPVVEIRPGLARTALRRRWRIIAAALVIGLLGGWSTAVLTTPSFTSTAVLFLNPLNGNPYSPDTSTARADQLTALETEATLLRTAAVGQPANSTASGTLAGEPETRVTVTVPSNSQVLRVSYRADTAEEARLGAQAFAVAYLDHRREQAEATATRQQKHLEEQLESTRDLLDRSERQLREAVEDGAQLGASPHTARAIVRQQQAQTYANQIAQLRIEISAVTSAPTDPGDVVSPAVLATAPDGLPEPLVITAGLLVGLVLGIVTALIREHNDDRVYDPYDVVALGAGPVLAVLPHPHPLAMPGSAASDATTTLAHDTAEAFRVLRTAVLTGVDARSAVVSVSALTGDVVGRGVAIGLAHTLERAGRRVCLITVGLVDDTVPVTGHGLSDLLNASNGSVPDDQLAEALHTGPGTLVVLGPGRSPAAADDLVSSPALPIVLNRLRELVEFVVIDAPAITTAAGQELAAVADATVLVAHLEQSRHDHLLAAQDALAHRQARPLGVALIEQPRRIRAFEHSDPWSVLSLRPAERAVGRHGEATSPKSHREQLADIGSGGRR